MSDAPFHHGLADGPAVGRAVWRQASDGTRLRMAHWTGSGAGTVFLFPGRGEYAEKYGPAAGELAKAGYDTLVIDWRGQGLSDRKPRDPRIGHVGSFAEYQQDVQAMLALAAEWNLPRPYYLLSHSMGGTIALRALLQDMPVSAAVFSGPMWGLVMPGHMRVVAHVVSAAATWTGQSHRLTPTTSRESYVVTQPFDGNLLTKDPQMYDWLKGQMIAAPDLVLGGPSLGWLRAALYECRWLMRQPAPLTPCLAVLGADERIVDPAPVRKYLGHWTGGNIVTYPGTEHEVMMEKPSPRARFYAQTIALFRNHAAPR